MDIISEVKKLNLPFGQYLVFGSGPLQIHGIRETRDIDLLVLPELYDQLKNEGWEEKEWETTPGSYLSKGNVEVVSNWDYWEYNPDPIWLIKNAEIIKEIPFAPIEEVLKWKKAFNREKDQKDIKLIEEFIQKNHL